MLIKLIEIPEQNNIVVSGKVCRTTTADYFGEVDCYYDADFACDECVFVVGRGNKDKRFGKRPWRKQDW